LSRRSSEPYGYGTWDKLPSGSVRCRIVIAGERRTITGPSRKAVREELARLQEWKLRTQTGAAPPPPRARDITYAALEEHLRRRYQTTGTRRGRHGRPYSPLTIQNYELLLRQVLAWWGPRLVVGTRAIDVERYVEHLQDKGYAPNSIRHRLDRLSELMDTAVRLGWIAYRPCPIERPAPQERTLPEAIPEADYVALLEAARGLDDPRPRLVCLLAGDAGLRRSEIAHLHCGEVTLRAWDGASWGSLVVVSEGDRRAKSGRGRTVPVFTARLHDALTAAMGRTSDPVVRGVADAGAVYALACRAWAAAWPETRHRVSRGPERGARTRARARLHSLRHRFGTILADAGVPTKAIRELMGHATILTTERYLRRQYPGIPAGAAPALTGRGPEWSRVGQVGHDGADTGRAESTERQ
jgi:integrase